MMSKTNQLNSRKLYFPFLLMSFFMTFFGIILFFLLLSFFSMFFSVFFLTIALFMTLLFFLMVLGVLLFVTIEVLLFVLLIAVVFTIISVGVSWLLGGLEQSMTWWVIAGLFVLFVVLVLALVLVYKKRSRKSSECCEEQIETHELEMHPETYNNNHCDGLMSPRVVNF